MPVYALLAVAIVPWIVWLAWTLPERSVSAHYRLGWVGFDAWVSRTGPRGWASLIVVVLFMASVPLFSLGIIGEYIRLIFLEVKKRPTYIDDDRRARDDAAHEVIARPHVGRPGRVGARPPG